MASALLGSTGPADAVWGGGLRARLDALPPNHPSSAGFADRVSSYATDKPERAEPRVSPQTVTYKGRAVDRRGDGVVDEAARVFQPAERAIAEALADRGSVVTALAEDHSLRRRQPDALVDGRVTEFKSVRPGAADATVKNQLLAARGQAPNVVVDTRGSGLAEDGTALGLRRFLGSPWGRDHYETILILGDGYVIETARREEQMTPHDVFIATTDPAPEVQEVIAAALGAAFEPTRDDEPVPALAVGPIKVFFHDSHPFGDDVDLPVSRYQYWVSVQDSGRDEDRQLAVAQRVFDAVKATGRQFLLSYGLQGAIASHP